MKKIKRLLRLVTVILLIICVGICISDTADFTCKEYEIENPRIPESFDGFRIVMVSDLHNAQFGDENHKLISAIKDSDPDIIVITGDLADSSHTDINVALSFAQNAVKIAPTYYVSGNHEAWLEENEYKALEKGLLDAGVEVLSNKITEIERNGEYISLIGVTDPDFDMTYSNSSFTENVTELTGNALHYTVLLSHRPEYFSLYCESGADLVLSGHTHGGQISLPFIGALMAPGQDIFPEYDKGLFRQDDTTMIISPGLGNSIIPFRFLNKSELTVITLFAS